MPVRWSKVKSRVKLLLTDAVCDRVDFHSTKYRHAHDGDGRAWITLDGEEIINMATVVAWRTEYDAAFQQDALRKSAIQGAPATPASIWAVTKMHMHDESIFWQHEFGQALFDYPNLPVDEILLSTNPLIRAIGTLDRRVGKAQLLTLLQTESHPLVMRLGAFRCRAEDWSG